MTSPQNICFQYIFSNLKISFGIFQNICTEYMKSEKKYDLDLDIDLVYVGELNLIPHSI